MSINKDKLIAYAQLMRIDRPIGSLLLLWPTLWALFLANRGMPDLGILVIFVLGVLFMRSAGCVLNDYADRHFDGQVKRTAGRPLATGRASAREAKLLFVFLLILSFALVLQLNRYAIALSVVAAILAMVYPFMKRYMEVPQLVLGIAFGWSIPMAYAASIERFPLECWLLFLANLAWTVAYDTEYAMVDRDDDLRIGVKSSAILFGQYDYQIIALLQLVCLALLAYIGVLSALHWTFFCGFSCCTFIIYLSNKAQQNTQQRELF